MQKFQILDYDPWQRSKQRTKSSTLPPVLQTSGQKKSKMKTLTSVQPGLYSKPTMLMTSQPRNPQDLRGGKVDSGKTQASIRLMKMMLRNRRTSLQELRSHENFLTRLNGELVRNIQDMEDSAAQKVRAMLQQQDIFATVMDILEYSNNKKLQQMKCELQEWQEKEEAKMRHLERQVEQLNARIHKTKEEVSFLSTYMDHEYPVRSVQIASLARQLQQVKDSQQDELDDLNEMRRKVLESLSNKIQKKKRKLLRSLVVKTQSPYEEALLQKTRDSQDILKCTGRFREVHPRYGRHPQHPCGRAAALLDGGVLGCPCFPALLPTPGALSRLLPRPRPHSDPGLQFLPPSLLPSPLLLPPPLPTSLPPSLLLVGVATWARWEHPEESLCVPFYQ
uniref:Chromosome 22 C20orf96 homolog n=1 Tax=Equus caballus TaxID=9796 RepID=A0A3Q2LEA7_HORSE